MEYIRTWWSKYIQVLSNNNFHKHSFKLTALTDQLSSLIGSIHKKKDLSLGRSNVLFIILLGFMVAALMNCAPQTKTSSLPIDSLGTFSETGNEVIPEKWWTSFDDDMLNTMVDSALASNFNLKTAWQRLRAAQSVVDRESSALFPDIEASVRGSMDRPKPDFVGGESIRLGLSAVYEVDLWGRIRSGIEAERYRADATYTDYQTAAISLSAEIVRSWYQLVEAWNQVEIIDEQIETNEQVLDLLESRFGTGQIRGVDILRQRQLLESTREQKTYAESRVQVLENQLAVLLGRPPQVGINYTLDTLPDLPPLPETGVPSELVQRRPDVQSAFNLLKAADRELASAISNQYPRISLSTSASLRANDFDNLFENWAYSLGGNIVAPLIYGGRLSAEVDRNEAVKQQRLYEYGQTVLIAFQEVEDALILESKQIESIEAIKAQLNLARQSYEQLRIEYFNGTSPYLDVLTSLNEVQQLRRSLLSANLTLLEYRISLYRALAGGFETARERDDGNVE